MLDEQALRQFEVDYVTFYDGTGHRLGPSECTLTGTRLIVNDVRGGIHQIQLRDISGIGMPSRSAAPKMLRISLPGQAYDIGCKTKDQTDAVAYWIGQAIRGTLSPASDSPDQEQIPRITSRRNPAVSAFLSFLIPGLGTIVNGHIRRGVIILASYYLLLIIGFATPAHLLLVIPIGLWIWGMIDAYSSA